MKRQEEEEEEEERVVLAGALCAGCLQWGSGLSLRVEHTTVYPKISGLAAWSENCKCYNSLPLSAVVSLFCESVQ
jgi:hypothetical protein